MLHTIDPLPGNTPGRPEESSKTEERERKEVPIELHKLDDSVLVYSSEDGEVPGLDDTSKGAEATGSPATATHDGGPAKDSCCHENEGESGVDVTPFIEVVFKGERRGYYLNASGLALEEGMSVIVEAEKGLDLGVVGSMGDTAYMKSRLRQRPCEGEMKKIVRLATDADLNVMGYHREQEQTAFHICLDRIHKLDLPMKLVDVEYQFDRNRITF